MIQDEHMHFIGKVAQKAIIEHSGKILVCRGNGDSLWEFPGGRLNQDGSPLENLIREIYEELEMQIHSIKPLHVCYSLHVQSNTKRFFIAYLAQTNHPHFNLDENELEEAKWITPDELKDISLFEDCREAANYFLNNKF